MDQPFVERAEDVLLDALVLAEIRAQPATEQQIVARATSWAPPFAEEKVRAAVSRLLAEEHLEEDDRATLALTEDGHEDLQKVEPWMRAALHRLAQQGTQRPFA